MAKQREYTYYLEPVKSNFAHTNEVISKMLADTASPSSDSSAGTDILRGVICADGNEHNLYRCPHGLLFMLWCSRKNLEINFRVFAQEGNGKIRDITKWYRMLHQKKEKTHAQF